MNKATQPSDRGLVRSAGIVSVSVTASRITGLIRESVLSSVFGAGAIYDAYVLGYRIPNLARELFAEGALSFAFVPTFTRYLTTKTAEEAGELSNITATLVLIITGIFCGLGLLASPLIVDLFAPGFHAIPGKSELAASLVRTMFPFLMLLALSAQAQGILYATHRFGIPAISPAIFNLTSVAAGLLLGYYIGPRLPSHWRFDLVHGMAGGVVIGGIAQLGFLLPAVWRAGFRWRPQWSLEHEGVRHILALMGPAIIGNASGQINVLVNTNFAAGIRDAAGHVINGPVSWLAYAYRFFILPLGLFGVAIASAAIPRLSRNVAESNFEEFRATLSRSLLMILLLTVPASIGLAVLGESMIGIVYQHGRFLASDTHQTALALSCYAAGLAGYAVLKLVSPAFYTLGDSRTPMYVSLAAVLVNGAAAFVTVRILNFGHAGLALASSVVSTFSSITLLLLLRSRIGGFDARPLLNAFIKIAAAAAIMGAICRLLVNADHALIHSPSLARIADIILGVPAGVISFYAFGMLLRVPELTAARAELLRKLGRGTRGGGAA